MSALQVKEAMHATRKLGGKNHVLWGGREPVPVSALHEPQRTRQGRAS